MALEPDGLRIRLRAEIVAVAILVCPHCRRYVRVDHHRATPMVFEVHGLHEVRRMVDLRGATEGFLITGCRLMRTETVISPAAAEELARWFERS